VTDDLLADFVRADREQSLGTYGIHVHVEGRPPVQHRFRSDDRVNLYSVSKTFTAVAIGIAESEGRLTVEDRLVDHFPELRAADRFEKVTLRHLLTMTSGSGHMWFADGRVDAADLLHEFVAEPLVAEPGTRFAYTGSGGPVRMHGAYGQIALIDHSRRAAITVTAHTEDETAQLTALHDLVLARLN
jgi:CubicO group peptidase (beta-lactamase class C family)